MKTEKTTFTEKHFFRCLDGNSGIEDIAVETLDPQQFDWSLNPFRYVNKFQFRTLLVANTEYTAGRGQPKMRVTLSSNVPVKISPTYVVDGQRLNADGLFRLDKQLYGKTPPWEADKAIQLRNQKIEILPDAVIIPSVPSRDKSREGESGSPDTEDHISPNRNA